MELWIPVFLMLITQPTEITETANGIRAQAINIEHEILTRLQELVLYIST